jgi:hypothetical protein
MYEVLLVTRCTVFLLGTGTSQSPEEITDGQRFDLLHEEGDFLFAPWGPLLILRAPPSQAKRPECEADESRLSSSEVKESPKCRGFRRLGALFTVQTTVGTA